MTLSKGHFLRLLSLNLGGRADKHGDWATRATRIAGVINENGVDMLVAQAAPLGDDGRFSPELQMLLPGHDNVAIAVPAGVEPPNAMAIASTYDLAEVTEADLSRQEGEDSFLRKLLAARVPAAKLTIVDAHFSWVDAQAGDNVREALAFVAGIEGDVLLIGDMNQPRDGAAMRTLADAGFVDCWARQEPEAGKGKGFTFETGKLWGRIDYVWERAARPRVRWMRTVGGEGGAALSDHLGLLVDIE